MATVALMTVTIYGIPSCGTVKKARKWLDEQGVSYDWVDLRFAAPEPERVERWLEAFGAKAMRNTSGGAYRALGPEKKGWTEGQWLSAFQREVMLLKRPIVEIDGAPATVGFAEATYREIFADAIG